MVDYSNIHPLQWRQTRPYAEAVTRLRDEDASEMAKLIDHAIHQRGRMPSNLDSEIFGTYAAWSFWRGNRNIIAVDAALWELLRLSSCGDVPLAAIRWPFDKFFIAVPSGNGLSLGDSDDPDEDVELDGAYIFITGEFLNIYPAFRHRTRKGSARQWPAVFDCVSFCRNRITEGVTFRNWLMQTVDQPESETTSDLTHDISRALAPILNVLCYLSTSPKMHQDWSSPPPRSLTEALVTGSRRKREVARQDIAQLGILPINVIGRDVSSRSREGGAGAVSPHWRRGHFHTYWTGKGRAVPKIKWVRPVVINADKGEPQGVHIHPLSGGDD